MIISLSQREREEKALLPRRCSETVLVIAKEENL